MYQKAVVWKSRWCSGQLLLKYSICKNETLALIRLPDQFPQFFLAQTSKVSVFTL